MNTTVKGSFISTTGKVAIGIVAAAIITAAAAASYWVINEIREILRGH